MARRWRGVVSFLAVGAVSLGVACETVESDPYPQTTPAITGSGRERPPSQTRPEVEIARATIGPAGGSVSAEGATIEVPAGAVASDTTFVIKRLDPVDIVLPFTAVLAGTVYALEPDDVTFLVPVTVRFALDPAKRPVDGRGAVFLLRSPKAAGQWETKGGGAASQASVIARTDHLSDWAPVAAREESCLFESGSCAPDGGAGIDCRLPRDGAGARCTGSAPPYACTCSGGESVIAWLDEPPSDSVSSALAAACGATCPDGGGAEDAGAEDAGAEDASADDGGSTGACIVSASCSAYTHGAAGDGGEDPDAGDPDAALAETGWECTTRSTTRTLSCRHADGTATASCSCAAANDGGAFDPDASAGAVFTIPASQAIPAEAEIVQAWKDHCGGACVPPSPSDGGSDAEPDAEPDGGSDGG